MANWKKVKILTIHSYWNLGEIIHLENAENELDFPCL